MRLARYFGTSPDVWLRLQDRYDLEAYDQENGSRIEQEVEILDRKTGPREYLTQEEPYEI